MRKSVVGWVWCAVCALGLLQVLGSRALAVSTMADWVGLNNTQTGTGIWPDFDNQVVGADGLPGHDENFVVTSSTSIGGTLQAKINYNQSPNNNWPLGTANVNHEHLFLSDQALESTLNYTTPLHMDGTISFDTPSGTATEPNICFCWYNSDDTRHRIGIGLSNVVESGTGGPNPDQLRVDLGYASSISGVTKFYYVTKDGTTSQVGDNSRIPDGTYQFSFDYTPGPSGGFGGSVSASVTNGTTTWSYTRAPLENDPWNLDFFNFDKFGVVIRSTGQTTFWNDYQLSFSNVTYTGGTAVPGVPGDYNNNGTVDAADYVAWRKGGTLANEVDNPGTVDAADYTEWRARFGNTSGSGLGAGAVPEPTSAALVLLAGLATVASWRRRS